MKKCPFCKEEIQDEAIKCRHCGEMLVARTQRVGIFDVDADTTVPGKKKGSLTVVGYLGVVMGALIIAASCYGFTSGNAADAGGIFFVFMVGCGFAIGSYLWARRG